MTPHRGRSAHRVFGLCRKRSGGEAGQADRQQTDHSGQEQAQTRFCQEKH